jgi:hypothetical protein
LIKQSNSTPKAHKSSIAEAKNMEMIEIPGNVFKRLVLKMINDL